MCEQSAGCGLRLRSVDMKESIKQRQTLSLNQSNRQLMDVLKSQPLQYGRQSRHVASPTPFFDTTSSVFELGWDLKEN